MTTRQTLLFLLNFCYLLSFLGCSGLEKTEYDKLRRKNCKGEFITRKKGEYLAPLATPKLREREPYPWEEIESGDIPKILKEHFRCKGKSSNPLASNDKDPKNPQTIKDCDGRHGLPYISGKEGVYPILPELLNYIQKKTKKKVIITSGYRCPTHNFYSDPSTYNKTSKHMIGAEVDFFVQGMEDKPLEIIPIIEEFYKENPKYSGKTDFQTFQRYEKTDTNVSTKPWYNKEVFIKFFTENEGRDADNRHPFPYLSIQVRYDREKDERVVFTWEKAHQSPNLLSQ